MSENYRGVPNMISINTWFHISTNQKKEKKIIFKFNLVKNAL